MDNGIQQAAREWNLMHRINAEQAWKATLRMRLAVGSRVSLAVDGADVLGTITENAAGFVSVDWDGHGVGSYVWGHEPMMEEVTR